MLKVHLIFWHPLSFTVSVSSIAFRSTSSISVVYGNPIEIGSNTSPNMTTSYVRKSNKYA